MADPFANIPLDIGPATPAQQPATQPPEPPAASTQPMPAPTPISAPRATPAPSITSTPLSVPKPLPKAAPAPSPLISRSMVSETKMPSAPARPVFIPKPEPAELTRVTPRHTGAGPLVGIIIIVVLFIFGGLYFWGAHLNAQEKAPLPLIRADASSQ